MKAILAAMFLLSLATTVAAPQLLDRLLERAKSLELDTPYVPPPGDPSAHHAAGYAKVMCTAVFLLLRMSDISLRHTRFGRSSVDP
jgi:hypothetical protein